MPFQHSWTRYITRALAFAAMAACSDATSPEDRTLRVGRYEYRASHGANRGFVAQSFSGTMTVLQATPDSVRVAFSVAGFRTEPAEWHAWQGDAYRVVADPLTSGDIATRLIRRGDSVSCDGSRAYLGPAGLESIDVTCAVSFVGP
jgi:hypothetical protein